MVGLIVLAGFIGMLRMVARGVHLWVVLLIEREVLYRLHDVALAKMNQSLNVVDEALVLDLCGLIDSLFDLHWVLIDLRSQFGRHLDLLMSLCNIVLQD